MNVVPSDATLGVVSQVWVTGEIAMPEGSSTVPSGATRAPWMVG